MNNTMLPSQQALSEAEMRTMPKDESAKHGDDGKEPAKVHLQEKGNRAAKRRRKHLYKKLNHKKGFRHGHGI